MKVLTAEEIALLTPEELIKYNAWLADEAAKKNVGDDDLVKKLVGERVQEELAPIKTKLDNAFAARDAALLKVAEYEQKEKDAAIQKLKDDGKHLEAYEQQLAEEKAKRVALEKTNTELTRDVNVRDVLKSFSFRNDKAADMAYQEITSQLVQNDKNVWVHRSGVSIKDFAASFATDENNSFLFAVKGNSGSGSSSNNTNKTHTNDGKKKSLFSMTQAEVLQLAREGKLKQ